MSGQEWGHVSHALVRNEAHWQFLSQIEPPKMLNILYVPKDFDGAEPLACHDETLKDMVCDWFGLEIDFPEVYPVYL